MSKVRGPLGSISASGTFGKSLIFQNWKGIPRVKKHRKPNQPNSAAQMDKRSIMSRAIIRWQGLSDEFKKLWEQYNIKARSGYNYFISEYIHWTCEDYVPSDDPRVPPTPPAPPPPPPPTPILDGLISWWKFDEGAGSFIGDSHGSNNGTAYNTDWVTGHKNDALEFNSSSDYVDWGHPASLNNLTAFTYSFWVYPKSWMPGSPQIDWLISKCDNSTDSIEFYFRMMPDYGHVHAIVRAAAGGTQAVSYSNDTVPLNSWTYISIAFDTDGDSKIHIYYGDTEVAYDQQDAHIPPFKNDETYNLELGRFRLENALYPRAIFDEMLVYNRQLSQSDISHNFNL